MPQGVQATGHLEGLGSGDPKSEDPIGDYWCHAFEGRALAIVSANEPGPFRVTVAMEGRVDASVEIVAVAPQSL